MSVERAPELSLPTRLETCSRCGDLCHENTLMVFSSFLSEDSLQGSEFWAVDADESLNPEPSCNSGREICRELGFGPVPASTTRNGLSIRC